MKNFLIVLAIAVSGATAVQADSVPTKAPVAAPYYSWTGFYAGLNLGGGWSRTSASYAANDPASAFVNTALNFTANGDRFNAAGISGGVQAGYNYQFDRRWVAGLEADFQGTSISGSSTTPYGAGSFNAIANNSIGYFGTFRGRLGYLATDRLMAYATAGLAYAQLNNGTSLKSTNGIVVVGLGGFSVTCSAAQPVCFAGSSNSITPGWTVGGGLEYALAGNWSVKGEYLYANFRDNVTAVAPAPGALFTPSTYGGKFNTDLNIARLGLNYQFGR